MRVLLDLKAKVQIQIRLSKRHSRCTKTHLRFPYKQLQFKCGFVNEEFFVFSDVTFSPTAN